MKKQMVLIAGETRIPVKDLIAPIKPKLVIVDEIPLVHVTAELQRVGTIGIESSREWISLLNEKIISSMGVSPALISGHRNMDILKKIDKVTPFRALTPKPNRAARRRANKGKK